MVELMMYLQTKFNLRENEWEEIQSFFEYKFIRRNNLFLEAGRICRSACFIIGGVMRYYVHNGDKGEQTLYFASANEYILDPASFYEQKTSLLNIETVTDCEVVTLSYENEKKLKAILPEWEYYSGRMIQSFVSELIYQKKLFHLDATKRYAMFVEKYPHYAQHIPLHFIASFLGITQQSLSRIRKASIKKS